MTTLRRIGPRRWLAPAFVAGCLALVATPSSAQPLDQQQMAAEMDDYFGSEKTLGLMGMIAGTATVGAGAALFFQDDDFLKGLSYPIGGFGLIELAAGSVIFFRTDGQLDDLKSQLADDPSAMKKDEIERMDAVNSQFDVLTILWIGVIAAGAGTSIYGFVDDNDTAKGIGIGLAGQGGLILTADLIAASNARQYTSALRRFQPTAAVGSRQAMLGFRGEF